MKPTVAALFRYPVKGLSAEEKSSILVTEDHGFPGDRSFAIALPTNSFDERKPTAKRKSEFLMLARYPKLAAIKASFSSIDRVLELEFEGSRIEASVDSAEGRLEISVFLEPFFEKKVSPEDQLRLVSGSEEHRFTDVATHSRTMMHSISVINLNSIRELEEAMGVALDIRRFRANIVIDGLPAWSEQDMFEREFQIGSLSFRGLWPTSRCPATQVDPNTGIRDGNVPRFLKSAFGHQNLGVYVSALSSGHLKVGDVVNFQPGNDFIPHIPYLESDSNVTTDEPPEMHLAQRLRAEFDLPEDLIKIVSEKPLAFEFFVAGSAAMDDPKVFGKWMVNELFGRLNQGGLSIDQSPVSASSLGLLCHSVEIGTIRSNDLKGILDLAWEGPIDIQQEIDGAAKALLSGHSSVKAECERIILENAENVAKFKGGNENILGWFVGQVMKSTSGAADAKVVRSEIEKLLRGVT